MALVINYDALRDEQGNFPEWVFLTDENGREILNPVTEYLGFAMMFVKMGEINEANHEEFYTRLLMFEKVTDNGLVTPEGDRVTLSIEDIRKHIGLKANVVTETAHKFDKWLVNVLRSDTIRFVQSRTTTLKPVA